MQKDEKAKIIDHTQSSGIILLGDMHEESESQEELFEILQEIVSISTKYNCDTFYQLGDICDKIRLSCEELYEFCWHVEYIKKNFKHFGIIEGNHDKFHNNISIISFLKIFGYNIHDDELLLDTKIGRILLGHWFVDKSKCAFGTHHRYTIEELNNKYKFDYCFLGHSHDYQKIDNIYHVGSARNVTFAEDSTTKKKCVVINDQGIQFIDLKSPIPIYNVSTIEELKTIPQRAKVRYLFKSFGSLKNDIDIVDQYKDKFTYFKKKIDFTPENINKETPTKSNMNESQIINEWLAKIEDNEIKNILSQEFKKELKI